MENMNNPDIQVCNLIESKINEIMVEVKQTDSTFETNPLHSELRILDWILYQVCSNEIKRL
jgi:hypothetical protein